MAVHVIFILWHVPVHVVIVILLYLPVLCIDHV